MTANGVQVQIGIQGGIPNAEQFSLLFELSRSFNAFIDLDELLPHVATQTRNVLHAESCAILLKIRVISATNREPLRELRHKQFRSDLYWRLDQFPIQIPPLRERRDDIPLLVARFVAASKKRQGKNIQGVSAEVLTLLTQYEWPGNVRELESEIERAVALTPPDALILPPALSDRLKAHRSLQVPLSTTSQSLKHVRLSFEREYVADVLRQQQGNAVKAAKILGISRQMLQKKIKAYGLRE